MHFQINWKGRIRNLAMGPSQPNSLLPMFEGVMNAIQTSEQRYDDKSLSKSKISINLIWRDDEEIDSIIVADNGVGLDESNFQAFLTADTEQKLEIGGKGVGRLTWLKVFKTVNVKTCYEHEGKLKYRTFNFGLDWDGLISDYSTNEISELEQPGTIIKLINMNTKYSRYFPKKIGTVTNKLVGHFIPFLIGSTCPQIYLQEENSKAGNSSIIPVHINKQIDENTFESQTETFDIGEFGSFELTSLLLDKRLSEGGGNHSALLTAHHRVVEVLPISNQLGLSKPIDHQKNPAVYLGILKGKFLDDNVTTERNKFEISEDDLKEITSEALNRVRTYLSEQISQMYDEKAEVVSRVITKFPRYSYLVKNARNFAEQKLKPNAKDEESVYSAMSIYDYRESRSIKGQLEKLISEGKDIFNKNGELHESVASLLDDVSSYNKASLAEYTVKRKLIIDLLECSLGHAIPEEGKNHEEKAIHQIICPMRCTSSDVAVDHHNLWLIDDRLTYYNFWASDKRIKAFAESSECKKEPDLVLFNGGSVFQRKNTQQPVVLIEFKRPGRKQYSSSEEPFDQIFTYIDELKEHKIQDANGALITEVSTETPFFCYLICDITKPIEDFLKRRDFNQVLPGGRGYYGFQKNYNAYIEVLNYRHLVDDARLRHEAFFEKLGINS